MLAQDTYRDWTSAFAEGSYFEGSWEQGQQIRFLAPSGDGMVAERAESRRPEFVSIRHRGTITGGVIDTHSDAVRAWANAYENYTFVDRGGATEVHVAIDITPDFEDYMNRTWPVALARLRAICEHA
jgi:hypothetical protein